MDIAIQKQFDELVNKLKNSDLNVQDPVAKLIISTLVHQAQKIRDKIESIPDKIVERLCDIYIPKNKIDAVPAICLVKPALKKKNEMLPILIGEGSSFSYKVSPKQSLTFSPLYETLFLPYSKLFLVTPSELRTEEDSIPLMLGKKGQVWLGLEINSEIESLYQVSFLIKGTKGIIPQKILIGDSNVDLSYSMAYDFENIPMVYPFDSQQSLSVFFDMLSIWKSELANSGDSQLLYISDTLVDRDTFKCKAYPKAFQQFMESSDLDKFSDNILWILFDFGPNYDVPKDIEIKPNIMPIVNVNLHSLTLTQSSPIAKLTKDNNEYFLKIVETSTASNKMGFNMMHEDVVVRDFDSSTYNKDLLYKDIRNLYNHFVDDYYAFIDYYNLKDGELIRSLRDTVNKIGRSVISQEGAKNTFEEGSYVMRNINLANQSNVTRVVYLTTNGKIGNSPKPGQFMENKKIPGIEKEVEIITDATGGEDKADPDHRYELLRYYTLTADRLYTKMDIDAFMRIHILKTFGKDEVKRISHTISIEGAAGEKGLQRGLYIDLSFKDKKNYNKALSMGLDRKLERMIQEKSCISMPICVKLISEE